jgi:hypothetical protein
MNQSDPHTLGEAHRNLVALSHALRQLRDSLTLLSFELKEYYCESDPVARGQAKHHFNQIMREIRRKSGRAPTMGLPIAKKVKPGVGPLSRLT